MMKRQISPWQQTFKKKNKCQPWPSELLDRHEMKET